MAETRAQSNRRIRQEALREQLKAKGLVQQYLNTIQKIDELEADSSDFTNELAKLKAANENRAKLINKVLPDEKFLEIEGELGLPQVVIKDLSGDK